MNVREAKDLLVQKTEQAALENVPFSDLERRMMYFTETGECPEDPIALNDAFEAKYDSEDYESKMSTLMRKARHRLEKEDPQSARIWDECIRELRKGDHYILILLCNTRGSQLASLPVLSWSFWKLLGVSLLVLIVGMVVFVALLHHADSIPR